MRERRIAHRYRLALPLQVRRVAPALADEDSFPGEIQDISTGGICFLGAKSFAKNEVLDFSMTLRGSAQAPEVLVAGRLRVVRVIEEAAGSVGVAGIIETFQIIRPDST